jgi:hypothetical protein
MACRLTRQARRLVWADHADRQKKRLSFAGSFGSEAFGYSCPKQKTVGAGAAMQYAGFVIILILLWIRPEYMFLLFYVFANYLLVFLISHVWQLTWADAPAYVMYSAVNIAVTLAIGAPIVALFKWLKTRKTGRDKELDREMERVRAEIAARDGRPPAT